ncbi:F1 complex, delta/epsilon subunit of ATPase [Cladochytrium replicatum]|nr:F1 complex, delta/epsilon subunit of ATPase [Cladochytrium replicatum]
MLRPAAAVVRSSSLILSRVPFARSRLYATEAAASKGKLLINFVLPHQTILKSHEATQVNITSTDGEMGILADHVPTIAELVPGLVEIFGDKPQKYFVSGGFAVINPDSTLNINAAEAFPLDQIDFDAAKRQLEEANRKVSSATTEADRAAAKIEIQVYEALSYAALKK